MKREIICQDKYEAQKLASLIFIRDGKETFITQIVNVVDNEVVVLLKDKSVHSILLKNSKEVEYFADFIQSVLEEQHKIADATTFENKVEIKKE